MIDCTTGKCQCQKLHISFLPTLTCTYDINRFGKRLNSLSVLLLRDGIILIATKNFWSNTAEKPNDMAAIDTGMNYENDNSVSAVPNAVKQRRDYIKPQLVQVVQLKPFAAWHEVRLERPPRDMRLGHPCFT